MIIDVFQEVRVAHHSAVVFVSSLNATVAPKKIKEVIVTHKAGKERRANIDTFLILKKCANTHPIEDFWWCCDFF